MSSPGDTFARSGEPSSTRPTGFDSLPASWPEILAVVAAVVIADLTIYRGYGFSGYAAFVIVLPLLCWLGSGRCRLVPAEFVLLAAAAAVSFRLAWLGSSMAMATGLVLALAFSMRHAGRTPFVPELLVFAATLIGNGYHRLQQYSRGSRVRGAAAGTHPYIGVLLPATVVLVFATLFVLANPDLVSIVSKRLEYLSHSARQWLKQFSAFEVVFWCGVGWLSAGYIQPQWFGAWSSENEVLGEQESSDKLPEHVYGAFRNTLISVTLLFAAYLAFEFSTLWFRTFPAGFYYAGYAHQGAAWLTIALMIATLVLSLIFRCRGATDPRESRLRIWAWLWSLENLLLAMAVYNRMLIYIDFNGMTRMRVIGLFGITTVVIGFSLVVYKIVRGKRFSWLVRRQLTALALMIGLHSVTPVDYWIHQYNVQQILAGELAPSVQIVAHPISDEGLLVLEPLLNCDDQTIRDGIQAMLAQRLNSFHTEPEPSHWTAYQLARWLLEKKLQSLNEQLKPLEDNLNQASRLREKYLDYAMQWY